MRWLRGRQTIKMDRERELAHFTRAQKIIADGRRHIADQERRVAELDRDGHDTKSLKSRFPMLQIKVYNAEAKVSEEIAPA